MQYDHWWFEMHIDRYDAAYTKSPMITAGATMAFKAGMCDTAAQIYADPDCKLDLPRIGKFTIFCVGYVGCFQQVLFNVIYPKLFTGTGFKAAVQMVSSYEWNVSHSCYYSALFDSLLKVLSHWFVTSLSSSSSFVSIHFIFIFISFFSF